MSPIEDSTANTLTTISVTLAKHGEFFAKHEVMLEHLTEESREIKAALKDHQARSEVLFLQNATIVARVDGLASSHAALQGQVNDLKQWQLAEMTKRGADAVAINDKVNAAAVLASDKVNAASVLANAKVEEHKDSSNARLIAIATTIILTGFGVIWGIVQIYLSAHPGH